MLFSPRTPEPDAPKPDCKRTIRKHIVTNVDVGPRQIPSKQIHYIKQNILNVIRHVSRLSKPFVQDDVRGHEMNLEDHGLVKKMHNDRGTKNRVIVFKLCCRFVIRLINAFVL